MGDWIDEEAQRRRSGIRRPLSQSEHAAIDARYPGATLEHCCECDAATGRAGHGDDSLYADDGSGPYCEECWEDRSDGDG